MDQESFLISKTHLDTRSVEPQFQFEAWKQAASALWNLHPWIKDKQSLVASTTEWHSGRLLFRRSSTEGHVGSPAQSLPADPTSLSLEIQDDGVAQNLVSDTIWTRKTGDIYLNGGRVSRFAVKNLSSRYVLIPHSLIGFDSQQHFQYAIFARGTLANRLLGSALAIAFDELDKVTVDQANLVEDALCSFVHPLILKEKPIDAGQDVLLRARQHALRRFIDEHLTSLDLNVDALAATFKISGSTVKRDFADDGGVNRYIWRRRLDRAYLELMETPPRRGLVALVSDAWMFSDEWSFRRAFRREFGVSPSDIASVEASTEIQC